MRTIEAIAVLSFFCLAEVAGAATVTYDLVLTSNPAQRDVTVLPGAPVNATLTATVQPASMPAETDGLAGVNVDVYTDFGVPQPQVMLSAAFLNAFPTLATGGSPNDDDLWQVGGFPPLGGPYTRNLGIGTPFVIGIVALQTPAVEATYAARANAASNPISVLNTSPPPTLIDATAVSGPGLTIHVSSTAPPADTDGDGVPDITDNCPNDANADQADADNDGLGDVCDSTPNGDGGNNGGGGAPFAFCGAGMAETALACAVGLFAIQALGRRRRY